VGDPRDKSNPDADATAVLRLELPAKKDAAPASASAPPAENPDDNATAVLRISVPGTSPDALTTLPPGAAAEAAGSTRQMPDARTGGPSAAPGTAPRPAPTSEDPFATAMRKVPSDEDTTGVAPPHAYASQPYAEEHTTPTDVLAPDASALRTETANVADLGALDENTGPTPARVSPVPQGYRASRAAAAAERAEPPPARQLPQPSPSAPGARGAASFIIKEPRQPRRRVNMLADRAVLGREAGCDIVIADPKVSKRHCELHWRGAELWVRDLGTTNGIEINRKGTQEARLYDGDLIVLGDSAVTANVTRPDKRADARPRPEKARRGRSRWMLYAVGAVALAGIAGGAATLVLFNRGQDTQASDRAALAAFLEQAWLSASGDPCEELSDGVLRIASRLDREGGLKPELREDLQEVSGRMAAWLDMAGPAAQLATERAADLRQPEMRTQADEFAKLVTRRVALALSLAEALASEARASDRPREEQPRPAHGGEPGRPLRDLLEQCRRFQGEFSPHVDGLARELNRLQ
jgi:hypothetical protein